MIDERLIRLCVFLARTSYPLGNKAELREWCETMYHFNVDFDLPEIDLICKEVIE